MDGIVNKWERDRIFEAKGVKKIVENLESVREVKRVMERLGREVKGKEEREKVETSEIMRRLRGFEEDEIGGLIKVIRSSLEVEGEEL